MNQAKEKCPGTAATVQSTEIKNQFEDTTTERRCKDPKSLLVLEDEINRAKQLASMAWTFFAALENDPYAAARHLPAIELFSTLSEDHAKNLKALVDELRGVSTR